MLSSKLRFCNLFQTLRKYATEWVVQIEDVTQFVKQQRSILLKQGKPVGEDDLTVARERVYTDVNPNTAARISLDYHTEDDKPIVVKGFISSRRGPATETLKPSEEGATAEDSEARLSNESTTEAQETINEVETKKVSCNHILLIYMR